MGRSHTRVAAAAVLLGALLGGAFSARASGGDEERAEELIRRAVELRRTGEDQAARPLLRQAYDLSHSARAVGQLGFCEQALGLWTEAETHLSEALRSAGKDPWVKKHRPVIEQALGTVKSHVGRLEISGLPVGAEVSINGALVGKLPLPDPLRLAAGIVEVELRAPGHSPVTKSLRVEGGEYHKLSLQAVKIAPPAPSAPATGEPAAASLAANSAAVSGSATATADPPVVQQISNGGPSAGSQGAGGLRRSLKFVSWGLAATAAGLGAYGIVRNRSLVDQFDSGCGNDARGNPRAAPGAPAGVSDESCADLKSLYQSAATLGLAGFIGAAAFATAGFVLWLTEPSTTSAEGPQSRDVALRSAAHWSCVPGLVGAGTAGIGCLLIF